MECTAYAQTLTHTLTHTYTHSQAHTLSLPLLQSSVQNQSTFTFMLGPAHCSCPCPPVPCPPPPSLVVGSLWGRMSECWPVFWPCPCFVNVQNLSNFIMLEFAGTSQLPQQQPQHDCTSPLPLILCPPVCCQLLWRLTSAHYKAQESSRTTSSATTSGSAPALPHDSWHFEARHQLVMS